MLAIAALAYLFTKYVAGRNGGLLGAGGGTAQFKVLGEEENFQGLDAVAVDIDQTVCGHPVLTSVSFA